MTWIAVGASLVSIVATLIIARLLARRLPRGPRSELADLVSTYREEQYQARGMPEHFTAENALRDRNDELAALNRFLRVAATEVEPTPLLEQASEELVTIVGVPQVWTLMFDELGSTATICAEYPRTEPTAVGSKLALDGDDYRVRAILDAGTPVVAPSHQLDDGKSPGSALGLPLVIQGETVGGLVLASPDRPHAFTPEHLAFASGIAAQASTALARNRASVAERLLRAAIEQLPEKVVITDIDGRIEYVNPAFSAVTGYSRQEALGQTPRLLKSGVHPAELFDAMWEKIRGGQTWYGQLANRRKSGEIFFENAIITPVRDARGDIVHYVAVGRDITRDLERDEQLRHAQRLEAVGQLAGGVAHDFNNILGAVVLQLELLELDQELPANISGGVGEIRAAVERAANLTRQLLLFSRRQAMSIQAHDLNVVIANLLRMLTRVIGERITVSFAPAAVPAFINADAGMIEQVLMNLCVNARDSMPAGGRLDIAVRCVTIDAEAERSSSSAHSGYFACLVVKDSGTGMSIETQRRIFEPFFTTKDVGKGTGLGLATSHGIVAQHGGWIDVTSALGEGSEFRIFFPALASIPEVVRSSGPATIQGGSEVILLVEDEALLRAMVSRLLRKVGYDVVEATNGREALRLFEQEDGRIDLVLTDMVMPEGISGAELGVRLREHRPGLEVLIMSGYSVELTGDGGALPPGMRFLSKPFTGKALGEAVQQALAALRQARASTPVIPQA